jgi:hypothetical protein
MSLRYSTGFVSATYNPLLNPNAPTIGTATAGGGQISITFTAPTIVGGSAITSYIATAQKTSDGTTVTATGASSPIVITGLDYVPYTVKVAAVNSSGASALSAASNSATPTEPAPTVIGQAYGGGFYAGQIGVSSVATHYLVVGSLSTAQNSSIKWKNALTATTGADSDIDGPQNTADMVADGNSTVYPAAHFCNDLVTGGYSDWYMPAKNELEICYYNLKPYTFSNNTTSGSNINAVPSRTSNYTSGNPAQTSATIFRDSNAQAFQSGTYWSSTEGSATKAWRQYFYYGLQYQINKTGNYRVRAIRRVAV